VAVGDVVLAEEIVEVGVECASGDLQVALDFFVGPAVLEAAEDLVAAGGGAVELAEGGAFAAAELEPGGWGDFVAEEEAGGHVGDEVVPAGFVEGGEVEDVVAFGAGEGGGRFGEGFELDGRMSGRSARPTSRSGRPTSNRNVRGSDVAKFKSGIWVEEAGDEAHGEGVVDFADWFFAAGAEPAVADEAVVVVGEGEVVDITLTPTLFRRSGRGGRARSGRGGRIVMLYLLVGGA